MFFWVFLGLPKGLLGMICCLFCSFKQSQWSLVQAGLFGRKGIDAVFHLSCYFVCAKNTRL